jgi:precorrin-6Y C5,15-methyltransferase (decarboxylating)
VFWDVGAGSGSLAVEACLAASGLRAYAVEKTPDGLGHIRENRRRFRVAGLVPVAGVAPDVLTELPDPDSAFIGGSGGNLAQILDACRARLRPGGTLVVSAVLTETLGETLAWCRERGVPSMFREVSAARSRPVAGRHRLEPQNPVTLVQIVVPDPGDAQ